MGTKQVAFTLHTEDHDRLKRLSASMDRTYSQTVALALRRLEESNQPDASGDASSGLAYAQLHPTSAAPGGRKCGSCAPLASVSGKSADSFIETMASVDWIGFR
jgi:hypothetical protein